MSLKPRNIDFQETWVNLKETVKGVVALNKVSRNVWSNRFSDVYALCVAQPEPLAEKLYEETKLFLEEHVSGLLERVKGTDTEVTLANDDLLNRYYDAWLEYSQGVSYLNCLYLYLNLQFVKKQKLSEAEVIYGASAAVTDTTNPDSMGKLEVGELGLLIWERQLIRKLGDSLTTRILSAYSACRENKHCSTPETVITTVIQSFVQVQAYRARNPLALYREMVERPLLELCEKQHSLRAAVWQERNDVCQYTEDVLQGLEQELRLASRLLPSVSLDGVRACYERACVSARLQWLHTECPRLATEQQQKHLANMYKLLRPIPDALKPLQQALQRQIEKEGKEALAKMDNENAHIQFVDSMLAIHNKYKTLFTEVFQGDQSFMGSLDMACSAVINARPDPNQACRSPDLLAKFCDCLLRKRNPERTGAIVDGDVEERLTSAIIVFKYIDDKDLFQSYYARALTKRLIYHLSASMDHEESMIDKLKQACGYEFTNKLHRMFTDIAVSTDLNTKFQEHLRTKDIELGIGVSIQVLQAGAWHVGGASACALSPPAEPWRACLLFEEFYSAAYSGRRLSWLHALCSGELRTRYTQRSHIVAAAAPQCAALLAYQHRDQYQASELRQTLQMPSEAFVRHIKGLVDAGLLTVDGDLEQEETCRLSLNLSWSSRRARVRVTCGAAGPHTSAPVVSTPQTLHEDRKMYLQAAIVRIMKSRKVLRHNELIQEVVSQARSSFAPSVAMIKKCIETLIDKQYLERTPGHTDHYSYVA